ncbi:MAG TPA: hypothetical protein VG841_06820 [Caulobacterales bacterium]|nr:hypothetical protein [Caulobacterales bacterium]
MPSFVLYAIGFLILMGGLVYAAVLLHVPREWIAVGVLVMLGLGITSGVVKTRSKDVSQK